MMQSGQGFGAMPPLHVTQGFQYYRLPHAKYGSPLSPNYLKDTPPGGEGFPRENCILELRKEKSRDAARSRRGKENYEFYELAKMLPLPSAITSQLDKASIIRLTISYLKLKEFASNGDPPWISKQSNSAPLNNGKGKGGSSSRSLASRPLTTVVELFDDHQGTHILQSLDGFGFALAADGRFLYVSETVSIYLGLSQVELTGSSVFDYVHQQDHVEFAEQLGISLNQGQPMPSPTLSDDAPSSPAPSLMTMNNSTYKGLERTFCIRMKSTLTKRGCHFKSSGYRVVLLLCHLRPQAYPNTNRKSSPSQPPTLMGLVAVAIALPPPSINEVRLESDMFVTRLTFDFKIAHCEPRVSELLDYTAEELTGKNMYALCHGEDMPKLRACHVDLIQKGQVMSSYYRIMNKSGGYTWIQTCATVVITTKNSDEQSIICVNYVISGIEHENCIMDCSQMIGGCAQVENVKSGEDRVQKEYSNSQQSPDDVEHDKDDDHCKDHEESCDSPMSDKRVNNGNEHQLVQMSNEHEPPPNSGSQMAKEDLKVRGSNIGVGNKRGRKPKEKRLLLDMDRKRRRYHPQRMTMIAQQQLQQQGSHQLHRIGKKSSSRPTSPRSNSPIECSTKVHCDESDEEDAESPHGRSNWNRHDGRVDYPSSAEELANNTSVKDIEDAMNKHLPLIQTKELGEGKQRTTIQWIGGTPAAQQGTSGPSLSASALLRQLYVNRESVIRSNVHATRSPFFGASVDLQATLPTPPGGAVGPVDGSTYADPFVLSSKLPLGHPGDTPYAYPTPYATEAYGAMTPPSSVSPRDKLHPTVVGGFSETSGRWIDSAGGTGNGGNGGSGGMDTGTGSSSSHLPLKPQVYTAVPGLEPPPFPAHTQQGTLGNSGLILSEKESFMEFDFANLIQTESILSKYRIVVCTGCDDCVSEF
ncbi:hypothetical protein CHUAL_004059 [Chamberlinius hualienensis]